MSRPTYIRGEILPPAPKGMEVPSLDPLAASDADLNLIASWLDDRFEIPGTKIRFGLDAIIGWIPGIGDAIAALASMFIVIAAWKRGAARITLFRMSINLTVENALGAIPVIGDFAHIAWKANRRNYNLLIRDRHAARRHTWKDWLFVVGACVLVSALFIVPFALAVYLIRAHIR